VRPQQQQEITQCLDRVGQQGIQGSRAIAPQRPGIVRRRAASARLAGGPFVEKG
jgi:hypothetical protein